MELFLLAVQISNGAARLLDVIVACQQNLDPITISQGKLARIAQRDVRQVNRWVRELKDAGLIKLVKVKGRRYRRYYIGPRYAAWKKRGLE